MGRVPLPLNSPFSSWCLLLVSAARFLPFKYILFIFGEAGLVAHVYLRRAKSRSVGWCEFCFHQTFQDHIVRPSLLSAFGTRLEDSRQHILNNLVAFRSLLLRGLWSDHL